MNERIRTLRERSLSAIPCFSSERAKLLTDFYESGVPERVPVPVARAMAFHHILEHKTIWIGDGELIVGERGPAPKDTPSYPEICIHTLDDLDTLDKRHNVSFKVDEETKHLYDTRLISFWQGRSIRDRIFDAVSPEWRDAYEAGVFTEFMEQRAPGHTVLDGKIYRMGMKDFISRIDEAIEHLDFFGDPEALDKRDELRAMRIAANALIVYAHRHADAALRQLDKERDPARRAELHRIAEVCTRIPENAPQNFWEALQYYWFVHLGVITELNTWDSFNPGRLDQHLYPFYARELEEGTLTKEGARELLQAFWVKFNNQPAPPKVGVTAEESGTYTDFCLINVGGLKEDGTDGVNELSYLILDVIQEMRLLQPSSMVQISKKTPNQFLMRTLEIVKTGFGQPSIFNTDAIVQELLRQGKSLVDARNGGASGCVESGAFGKEAYILTGYFNLVKVLEITLHNGVDPRTGKTIGLKTGDPESWESYDDLFTAYQRQLNYFLDVKIKGNAVVERLYARYLPVPFLSLLVDDCIASGKDYHSGGARYNTSYIQCVGIGSITDELTALRHHVFDNQTVTMAELKAAMAANFVGYETLRQTLWDESPRYGNDEDYADDQARQVFEALFSAVDGRPNTRGGAHRINLLPTTCHIYFGSIVGAMPEGRYAKEPLSEGISPVQGADRKGPTAVIKSAAKLDQLRTGGTLLNQKFTPRFLEDESGLRQLMHLVRSYFAMDGHHIQFNVVTAALLREAQKNPEKFTDLIVRVAGYSDYFVGLSESLQNEIISRTEQMCN